MVEQSFVQQEYFRKVEIFISCRKLQDKDTFSKSDPFVNFSMKNSLNQNNQQWSKVGRTETMKDNLNPNFLKSFKVTYIFETRQDCLFEVFDDDGDKSESLGICQTTLGDIVGAKNNTLILDLKCPKQSTKQMGKIILRTEGIEDCNDILYMTWKGKKLPNTDGWFGKSDPFLRFNRLREQDSTEYIKVHETEVIMDNLEPLWKQFSIQAQRLCNGDYLRPIKLECWDWEKNLQFQYMGSVSFSIDEILKGKREFQLYNEIKKKNSGILLLDQFTFEKRFSFLDYIKGGAQLNLIMAVDFTGSNGDPRQQNSLHFINPNNGQFNQYQCAIQSVSEILLAYDYDKNVPCYGFGGKVNYPNLTTQTVQHCFPMTGNPQQVEVQGLLGIMQVYQYSLQHVSLSGPTLFNPIIQETMKVAQYCKQAASQQYIILVILTDGEIHDMAQTIDSIVEASDLPLSIIIVGVGPADFSKMNALDGDTGLVGTRGKAKRDLVQFVPFREMNGNPILLAKEVLAEIPDQFTQYFKQACIAPNQPPKIDIQNFQVSSYPPPQQQQQQQQQQQVQQQGQVQK